ncbi:helix-turn-helix domain-containing protein [Gordonia malaquae]|uniref:helix-turn-helix domain-containing protein n=1 Tax=Gordonia malaquae TaxID=410332 RepID=UPI003BF88ABF
MVYRRITNVSLAERVGVDVGTIAHLRRGARNNCDLAVAPRIAEVLEVPPNQLFVERVIDDCSGGNRNGLAITRKSA